MDTGDYDFVVVGAGIAGASVAYELAGLGSVLLLERETTPGYHSTGRSAAQYVETYGPPAVRRLTRASRAFYDRPPEGFCAQPLLSARPVMHIATGAQLAALGQAFERARAITPEVTRLDAAEALERVPVLREEALAGALLEPQAMDIDVHAIHHGYLRAARRRGAVLVTGAEVGECRRRGERWRVASSQGVFGAGVVVNAAGAWCDELARAAGVAPIGLQPMRRTAITFDPPAGHDPGAWPMVLDVEERFYFKPEAGRVLGSPADETPVAPCDVQPEELDVALAVDRIERATRLRIRRIHHRWAGLRSFVADRSLVIGMAADAPGFFWLAGQGGYGIQTAPAAARAAAALIGTGRLPDDLAALGLAPEQLAPARLARR